MATHITFSCPQVLNFFMFYLGICATDSMAQNLLFSFQLFIISVHSYNTWLPDTLETGRSIPGLLSHPTHTNTHRKTDRQTDTYTHTQYFFKWTSTFKFNSLESPQHSRSEYAVSWAGCVHCYVHCFPWECFL